MRSSCAPYKDCGTTKGGATKGGATKRKRKKKLTYKKNILGTPLKRCSTQPKTGFYRNGYCMTGPNDLGTHTVCAKMNQGFLDYTASKGNDLSSVVKDGERWCLCENRWLQAYNDGKAPKVIASATNARTDLKIQALINQRGGDKQLPQLRAIDKSNKKHVYRMKDPQKKRILAMDEGIRCEMRKGKTRRDAALSKKKRFNVLRLYRKNKDPKGCRILTQDMKYLDKRYGTGITQNVCKTKRKSKQQFLYNPNDPKRSFDVYIDKNPKDTIPIKYTTVQDVKDTINKLERLYKAGKYPHKRIWKVGMILKVRLGVLKDKKPKHYALANRYFKHLGERTKIKGEKERKKFKFKF
tara:strand:- start:255 stop:1313 length:1059 start_codon:yes stop_codon:yes gene_type:complete